MATKKLIGHDLDQVPSNADLGQLAYLNRDRVALVFPTVPAYDTKGPIYVPGSGLMEWDGTTYVAALVNAQQQFVATTDFTPGTSTVLTLTETPLAPEKNAMSIFFDAGYQQTSEWSYDNTTGEITFTSPIPEGVAKVEARWQAWL